MKAYKYILGVALTGLVASCSLDIAPISDQSELNLGQKQQDDSARVKYKDRAAMYAVYHNLYDVMKDRQEHWYLDAQLFGEARVDNAYAGTTGAEVVPVETNALDASNPDIARDWDRYLEDIAKANAVICNIDAVPDSTFSQEERNQWKAEAKIFRAMMMFDLAHWFGNIPVITTEAGDITSENMSTVYKEYFPESKDQLTAYKQVIKDCEEALQYAPDLNKGDKTILSKTVARTILAKVYAENPVTETDEKLQDWGKVRDYCEAVLADLGGEDNCLEPDFRDLFGWDAEAGDAKTRNSVETILEMQYFSGSGNWVNWMFGRNLANWDESFTWAKWITPSEDLMAAFRAAGDTIRQNQSIVWYECTWDNYYSHDHYPFAYKCRSGYNSIIKYRGADIMLLKAEAHAHLSELGDAAKLVNKVRTRVELPSLRDSECASQDALLDAILRERRLELCFEGQRLWDLIRFGKLLEVMNTLKDPRRLPQARPFTWDHALMPIPQTAMDKNSNLTQNTGY